MPIGVTLRGNRGKGEGDFTIQSGDVTREERFFYLTTAIPFGPLDELCEWAQTHLGARPPDPQELQGLKLPDFLARAVAAGLRVTAPDVTRVGLAIDQPHGLLHLEVCAEVPQDPPSLPGLGIIEITGIGFMLTKATSATFAPEAKGACREGTAPDPIAQSQGERTC